MNLTWSASFVVSTEMQTTATLAPAGLFILLPLATPIRSRVGPQILCTDPDRFLETARCKSGQKNGVSEKFYCVSRHSRASDRIPNPHQLGDCPKMGEHSSVDFSEVYDKNILYFGLTYPTQCSIIMST